jgi:hypothetical protein
LSGRRVEARLAGTTTISRGDEIIGEA